MRSIPLCYIIIILCTAFGPTEGGKNKMASMRNAQPLAQFAYNYNTINVLSKCSNIISHRSSVFEGRHNAHRSSKVGTSIIHLRRSTHLSSILESRHIDRRSSMVDTSIFKDRRRKHRTNNPTSHRHSDNSSPNIVRNGAR